MSESLWRIWSAKETALIDTDTGAGGIPVASSSRSSGRHRGCCGLGSRSCGEPRGLLLPLMLYTPNAAIAGGGGRLERFRGVLGQMVAEAYEVLWQRPVIPVAALIVTPTTGGGRRPRRAV